MEAGGLTATNVQMNSILREFSRKEEECAQLRHQVDVVTKQVIFFFFFFFFFFYYFFFFFLFSFVLYTKF